MCVLYFVVIWFYLYSIPTEWFPFFLAIRFPVFFSMVNSTFCVSFTEETLTSFSEELLLSELTELNHHLMNNSVRSLSHHFRMVILHLVKQYYHIPPSVHPQYTQALLSHSSICSPSVHTSSIITFLHLFTLSTHKHYYHIPPSVHPQHTQAV